MKMMMRIFFNHKLRARVRLVVLKVTAWRKQCKATRILSASGLGVFFAFFFKEQEHPWESLMWMICIYIFHLMYNFYIYDQLDLVVVRAIKEKEVCLTEVLRLWVLFIKSSSLSPRVAKFSEKLENCKLVFNNNGSLLCHLVMLTFRTEPVWCLKVCHNK